MLYNKRNKMLKKNSHTKSKAFSLLEVSMVLLIVGIVVAGITLSTSMIKNSRISSARTLTEKSPILTTSDSALWLETSFSERLTSADGSEVGDEDSLSGWSDSRKSSDKVVVVAVGDGPVFSNTINYVQTVKFDGSESNYLNIEDASFLNGTDYTIFVVEKRLSEGGNNFFIGDVSAVDANKSLLLGYNGDSQVVHSQSGLGSSSLGSYVAGVSDYGSSRDEPRVFAFVQDSVEGKSIYVNGVLAARDVDDKSQLSGLVSLAIGKGYDGEIGEVSIFTRALNHTERKNIENYLGTKWNSEIHRKTGVDSSGGAFADVIDCVGYAVTKSGCEVSCAVNVAGVSSSLLENDTSGTLSCNQDGFDSSGRVSYSCSSGVLTTSGSCVCEEGFTYSNGECLSNCAIDVTGIVETEVSPTAAAATLACDSASGYSGSITYTCSSGVASVSGSCFKDCAVSGINGVTATSVSQSSGSISCDSSANFAGNISYSCSGGVLSTSGTCGCASGYSLVGSSCQQGCNVSITGASTTTVTASSGSFNCDQTGYSGSISYTCTGGVFATNNACAIGSGGGSCTGGTITTVAGDSLHTFNSSGTLTCPTARTAQVLVVGGGGSGGSAQESGAGGGGGGGGVVYAASYPVTTTPISVTVGNGGASVNYSTNGNRGLNGLNGSDSVFGTITAKGGGYGGAYLPGTVTTAGNAGGSGGGGGGAFGASPGATNQTAQTNASSYYGNVGGSPINGSPYNAGGGGGAGSAGGAASSTSGGVGGSGISHSIRGTAVIFGAGGGGSGGGSSRPGGSGGSSGIGGAGGSGAGVSNVGTSGSYSTTGTAGNGGGGSNKNASGAGSKGVVIVRYVASSSSCPAGYVASGSDCVRACTVSVAGVSTPSAVNSGSGTLTCNSNGYTGSVSYTCNSGSITTTGSCSCAAGHTGTNCGDCASGYSMISGVCQPSCSTGTIVGRTSSTTVASGNGTLSCNATGFNTSDSINYSCSGGSFSITSGACDTCNSGYTFSSNACKQNCVTPAITGLTTGTAVDHGSTSIECNATNYTGTINYTCNNGTFTQTGGSCSVNAVCTGGTITYPSGATVHTFTSSGTLRCPSNKTVQYLVVAGGGGGGRRHAGGGGAGGLLSGSLAINGNTNYSITVGGGGAGSTGGTNGGSGGNSIFASKTATGGGGGGSNNRVGIAGGSGGGGSNGTVGGNGTSGQGNKGGNQNNGNGCCHGYGNGGGGAGAAGANTTGSAGSAGGVGIQSSISGSNIYYAGGGGGGNGSNNSVYSGGSGGGGNGGTNAKNCTAGQANTGGGGGGGGANGSPSENGCNGGSGIVIIRY
jgi:hypothetical protein